MMATVRSRAHLPVGSAQWINDENEQITQFCGQEIEDFTFSARNEVEWLNEHMADIFSKNQMNVTEILKTPGKLRGKTPRTARKRNPLEAREVGQSVQKGRTITNVSVAFDRHLLGHCSNQRQPSAKSEPIQACSYLPSS